MSRRTLMIFCVFAIACGQRPVQADSASEPVPVSKKDQAPAGQHAYKSLYLLGDSIQVNGASDEAHRAASLVAASYPGTVTAKAVGGRALQYYAKDAATVKGTVEAIAATHASEIYIGMGYNDASKWTVEEFGAGLLALTTALHAALPEARIYCQTIVVHGGRIEPFSEAIRKNCKDGQVVEADTFGLQASDHTDAVHLNDSGHAKLAAGMRTAVGW